MPVIDVDKDMNVHIAWIEKGMVHNRFAYTTLSGVHYLSAAGENVTDVSLATTLNFKDNRLCLAYAYDSNGVSTIHFYEGNSPDSVSPSWSFQAYGSMPCVSLNVDSDLSWPEPTLIYKDDNGDVVWLNWGCEAIVSGDFLHGPITFLAIDDVAPPMDFSFIYMQSGLLYHAHVNTYMEPAPISGHYNYYEIFTGGSIGTNPLHPSIAYKYFNPEIVDIIWLEKADSSTFNIMHVRRPKIGLHDNIEAKPDNKASGLSVFPNPFHQTGGTTFTLPQRLAGVPATFRIYSVTGRLVFSRTLPAGAGPRKIVWNGGGLPGGIYLARLKDGKSITSKTIVMLP